MKDKLLDVFHFISVRSGALKIGKLDSPTILTRFIHERVSNHPEPNRKGVPRGELIGMGKKKFVVSLILALCSFSMREIAQALNTNYSMVRQWNADPDFQELLLKHREDFSGVWLRSFMEDQEEPITLLDGKYKDLDLYHPRLIEHLNQLITERNCHGRRS